jgi:hypothetical protein
MYLCVSCGSHNKHCLFPYKLLTRWALLWRWIAGFEDLMAMSMKIAVSWEVTSCCVIELEQISTTPLRVTSKRRRGVFCVVGTKYFE